jgi:hypothetical protein
MLYRYRWMILGFLALASGPLVLLGSQHAHRTETIRLAQVNFDALKLDAVSTAPGQLTVTASYKYTNIFRDAKYVYALAVKTEGGEFVWTEVVDNGQSAPRHNPLDITLAKTLNLQPGNYRVSVEIREDAAMTNFLGEIDKPYHPIGGKTSELVTVN